MYIEYGDHNDDDDIYDGYDDSNVMMMISMMLLIRTKNINLYNENSCDYFDRYDCYFDNRLLSYILAPYPKGYVQSLRYHTH